MTRKRFVKLLMAKGYTRNEAADYAKMASSQKSYQELFYECFVPKWSWTIERADSIGVMADRFATTGNALSEVSEAIRAFRAAFAMPYLYFY